MSFAEPYFAGFVRAFATEFEINEKKALAFTKKYKHVVQTPTPKPKPEPAEKKPTWPSEEDVRLAKYLLAEAIINYGEQHTILTPGDLKILAAKQPGHAFFVKDARGMSRGMSPGTTGSSKSNWSDLSASDKAQWAANSSKNPGAWFCIYQKALIMYKERQ